MSEIENHTLRLLQEMRSSLARLEAKVDEGFETLGDEIDAVKKAIAGETVLGRYAAAGVDGRLSDIETRLRALETARG